MRRGIDLSLSPELRQLPVPHNDVYSLQLLFQVFPCSLPQETSLSLNPCRRDAKSTLPLLLTGPYRLEGATLSNRLAASRNCEDSQRVYGCSDAFGKNKDSRSILPPAFGKNKETIWAEPLAVVLICGGSGYFLTLRSVNMFVVIEARANLLWG